MTTRTGTGGDSIARHHQSSRGAPAPRLAMTLACALLAGSAGGCSGAIGGESGERPAEESPSSGGGSGGEGRSPRGETPAPGGPFGGGTTGAPAAPVKDVAGALPLRRLTRLEYGNTVRDLLGVSTQAGEALPSDGFSESGYVVASPIGNVEAQRFQEAAESAAATAKLGELLPCPIAAGDAECARRFVTTFGRRAYRRPLAAAEIDALVTHFGKLRNDAKLDFEAAIRGLLEVMLQSPSFLYHRELGPEPAKLEGGLVRLGPHEVASRISYFLWSSMPDAALFAAADAGKLSTAAEIEAQARRMLADPRAANAIAEFHKLWLGIQEVPTLQKSAAHREWTGALASAALRETTAFVSSVFGSGGDGKLETLVTAPYSFVDEGLAKLYGIPGITGSQLRKATLPAVRAGIFTQPSFLATHALPGESHPVKRGHFLLVHGLCAELPAPPADIPPPKPPAPNVSTRERFAEHSRNECARGCHALIDPLGFAFENFDGIGKHRTIDGGKPVDASGSLELDGETKSFGQATDLVRHLARSTAFRTCVTKHWFGYGLGRKVGAEEAGSLNAAYQAFEAAGFDVRELLASMVRTRSFLYRTPAAGEVTQ